MQSLLPSKKNVLEKNYGGIFYLLALPKGKQLQTPLLMNTIQSSIIHIISILYQFLNIIFLFYGGLLILFYTSFL